MLDLQTIKTRAAALGFDLCGAAPCHPLPRNRAQYDRWIGRGWQSSLAYMERHADKRFDPAQLLDGARSVVVCAVGYKNRFSDGYPPQHRTRVASYATAVDYHDTLKRMLRRLLDDLRPLAPAMRARAFVDTAPLAEKQWAVEAGLGWIGRQSLLVTPRFGTFVLLGELLLTEPLDRYDTPMEGVGCGACRRCVEACPTGAVSDERMIDTARCISCHTVERPPEVRIDLHGWIFGCDLCQSVCPYNRRAPQHRLADFDPVFDPAAMDARAWLALDPDRFEAQCGRTPLMRSGLERLRANALRNLGGKDSDGNNDVDVDVDVDVDANANADVNGIHQ